MITTKIRTFGVELDYQVPESVEEFDRLAGREGACLQEAINNIVYRSSLASIRDVALHGDEEKGIVGLDEQTGIKRLEVQTGTKKDPETGEEEPITKWDPADSEMRYFKRICSEKGVEGEAFKDHLQAVADSVPFDPSRAPAAERGPKKPAKMYATLAKKAVDEGRAEAVAEKLSGLLKHTVAPDVESLARAIAENERRKRQALESEY